MKNETGIILGASIMGTLGYYFYQLAKTGEAINTITHFKVHSFSLTDATIQANVTLTNNGSVALKLSNIQVQAYFQKSTGQKALLLSSRLGNTSISVPARKSANFSLLLDTAKIHDIVQKIGQENYTSLLGSGIQVLTVTKAKVNGFIPYSKEEVITLSLKNIVK